MIKLSFICGGALRKVTINNRLIQMASQETGWIPVKVDLDKMESKKEGIRKKMGEEGYKLFDELAQLKTEGTMAMDIIKDFQKTGWRLVKRE